jgi:hypothetical protein
MARGMATTATIIPAIRYAVTAGSPKSFATLESKSPESKAIDRVKSTGVVKKIAFFQMNKIVYLMDFCKSKFT